MFILLVAFSALFVAGCAAFFSIKGLMILFSGSAIAIGIMASALEMGKLVAASFLHRHWKEINLFHKTYLSVAVAVLMLITSMGIFGFLTGAYQQHAAHVGTFETTLQSLEAEKATLTDGIKEYSERIKTLTSLRADQELRVKEAGNFKTPREQAYKAIETANNEIREKETAIAQSREKLTTLEKELAQTKIQMNTTTDIGSFKFIAEALGTNIESAVRYFIFALIFVFDPLAVTLVLALNFLLENKTPSKPKRVKSGQDLRPTTSEEGEESKHNFSKQVNTEEIDNSDKECEKSPHSPRTDNEPMQEPHHEEPHLSEDDRLYLNGKIDKAEYARRKRAGANNSVVTY